MPHNEDEDKSQDGYLLVQKQQMSATPQKDVNMIKNKFDSSNENGHQSYQTLDQDTRRVNRPIRGNHHGGLVPTGTENNADKINMEEPTPSFNSTKQATANMQLKAYDAPEQQPLNSRTRQQANAAISSQNVQPTRDDKNMPSYTPVRRNPANGSYQRTKPQSPKILLPQCFLDQPLNQGNNNGVYSSAQGSNKQSRLNTGIQGVMGIEKTMPSGKGISKIQPTIQKEDG